MRLRVVPPFGGRVCSCSAAAAPMTATIADAASRAELEQDKFRVHYIEKAPTPFAQFMAGFAGSRLGGALLQDSSLARVALARAMPETEAQLRFVENAVKDRDGAPVKSLAYCFCGW